MRVFGDKKCVFTLFSKSRVFAKNPPKTRLIQACFSKLRNQEFLFRKSARKNTLFRHFRKVNNVFLLKKHSVEKMGTEIKKVMSSFSCLRILFSVFLFSFQHFFNKKRNKHFQSAVLEHFFNKVDTKTKTTRVDYFQRVLIGKAKTNEVFFMSNKFSNYCFYSFSIFLLKGSVR